MAEESLNLPHPAPSARPLIYPHPLLPANSGSWPLTSAALVLVLTTRKATGAHHLAEI